MRSPSLPTDEAEIVTVFFSVKVERQQDSKKKKKVTVLPKTLYRGNERDTQSLPFDPGNQSTRSYAVSVFDF